MYEEIRPYTDSEVSSVLRRTVRDPELLKAVRGLVFAGWPIAIGRRLEPLIGLYLRWQVRNVHSVDQLQRVMESYMVRAVDTTTSGFTVSGIQNVPRDKACLFIGNHRDIVLDPAFMSLALSRSGLNTCRIAIGDNLLSKPYVANLMRLNKCFVVQRSVSGPRQLLKSYQQLSSYIEHSIVAEHSSIWLAQREGRAKDGDDRTEPAIVKMLHMSGKKSSRSLAEQIQTLCVVPVSISYEFDPCDQLKAAELLAAKEGKAYVKAEHEDIDSIAAGVSGRKGRVHLHFCEPLRGDFQSADDVALSIDRAVHAGYKLHSSNLFAYQQLCGDSAADLSADILSEVHGPHCDTETVARKAGEFEQRLSASSASVRDIVLEMYAMPILNRLRLFKE